MLMGLPIDSSFKAHLTATREQEQAGTKQPQPEDDRTPEQQQFDQRVNELETFGVQTVLLARIVNAIRGQDVIEIPGTNRPNTPPKGGATTARGLLAKFGFNPSLLDGQKKKE